MNWREHFSELKITTPKLSLVVADNQLLESLGEVAVAGVKPMYPTPFGTKWDHFSDNKKREFILERQSNLWKNFDVNNWCVPFTICVDSKPVGEVLVSSQRFREGGTFSTTSWLAGNWREKGLGWETRTAVLQFGFGALSARRALTKAFYDNENSLAITKNLGYELSGASMFVGGENTGRRLLHYRLNRRKWESYVRRKDIIMEGMCIHFP